jgi:hypothetical protein
LRAVDSVVETLHKALSKNGQTLESLERWKAEMPTEQEMLPKDKYTIFDRKEKRYRKAIHSTLDLFLSSRVRCYGHHFAPFTAGLRGHFRAPIDKPLIAFPVMGGVTGICTYANPFYSAELPKWTRVSQRVNPPGY